MLEPCYPPDDLLLNHLLHALQQADEPCCMTATDLSRSQGAKLEAVKKRLLCLRMLGLIQVADHQPKQYRLNRYGTERPHTLPDWCAHEEAEMLQATLLSRVMGEEPWPFNADRESTELPRGLKRKQTGRRTGR